VRLDTMGMRHSVGGRLAFVGLPYLQRAGVSRCGKGMHGYELLVQEGLIVPEASQRLRPDSTGASSAGWALATLAARASDVISERR
jgi:hypothetical protein